MPFRVKVLLSDFFSDYRKIAYVNINYETWETAKDLQDHIVKMFKISKSIYLCTEDRVLIPELESISVIKPKDVLM